MTGVEKKIIGFVREYAALIIFVLATLAGVLIRMAGMDFRSDDYNSFLSGWWNVIADQDFSGLSQQVGNYNIPYQVIIFILTRITGEALHAHKGSFDYLLGTDRTAELTARYSAEKLVSAATPPTFLVCSDDDGGVPPANSTMFYNALKAHGVPASLHILPSGGHGWGFRDSFRYKPQWQSALLDWLTAEK